MVASCEETRLVPNQICNSSERYSPEVFFPGAPFRVHSLQTPKDDATAQ